MLIIFLGAPGSGKGTISNILVEKNNFLHISTGDIFRNQIRSKTELGNKLKTLIEGGNLVDDKTTWEVTKTALEENNLNKNLILDGYPRNIDQAKYLDDYLVEQNFTDVKIIYYEVSKKMILQRLSGRMICPTCGKSYHKITLQPQNEGKCDIDGTDLYQREDDKPENILVRLKTYEEVTAPLVDFYKKQNKLIIIDGELPIDEIIKETLKYSKQ